MLTSECFLKLCMLNVFPYRTYMVAASLVSNILPFTIPKGKENNIDFVEVASKNKKKTKPCFKAYPKPWFPAKIFPAHFFKGSKFKF